MFTGFNWQQMVSAFIVLFAVIDIIGSIPIIINLKEKGKDVNATKATVISFALLIGFFYAGDMMLKLFHVDIESFAVAGAFVIFLMSLGWCFNLLSVVSILSIIMTWFGVNYYLSGLHSYGKTEGGDLLLWIWGAGLCVVLALALFARRRLKKYS